MNAAGLQPVNDQISDQFSVDWKKGTPTSKRRIKIQKKRYQFPDPTMQTFFPGIFKSRNSGSERFVKTACCPLLPSL